MIRQALVGYQITTQCRTSWLTSTAALLGIQARLVLKVVIDGPADGTIRIAKWIGHQDNNVAEYIALLEALQCAQGLKATALHMFSDSEVVVRQMSGEYSCRSPRLYSLNWICRKLARSLDFSISHVPREHNTEANGLASSLGRKSAARRKHC
jgi:ribonuclease HI